MRLSLPGGAPASGRAVSHTPDNTNHGWDLATGGDAGDVAASGGALAAGGDAGDVAASGEAVPLVATDVPTTATVGNSAVSYEGPFATVPLGTANPSSIIDNNAPHDKAWLDEVALPDRAWHPPLCHTLTDAITLGDAPNNAILNHDLGAVDKDSISATLTAAGVDEDPHKV